jgi:hypothetical protein
MQAPGFTAEYSLVPPSERYWEQVKPIDARAGGAPIRPAAACQGDDGSVCDCRGKCTAGPYGCACGFRP